MAKKVNGGNFYLGEGLEMDGKTLAVNGIKAEDGDLYITADEDKNVVIPQSIVIQSSTASSTKMFKITVIDDGTVSATEIV